MLESLFQVLQKQVDPSDSKFPLLKSTLPRIDLEGLTKGIDNVHIDVTLSPNFIQRAKGIASSLMDQQIGKERTRDRTVGPTPGEWEDFRNSYTQMVESALHRARQLGQTSIIELVQIAALKCLSRIVHEEIEHRRQVLRDGITSINDPTDPRRARLSERMAWMARNRIKIRFEMARHIFEHIARAEGGPIGELRQSLFGERWSLPREALLNPLLGAENPLDDQILMEQYALLGQGPEDPFSFAALDGFMPLLFQKKTPTKATEVALAKAQKEHAELVDELDRLRRKREATRAAETAAAPDTVREEFDFRINMANEELVRAREEYFKESYSWADVPENVDILFNSETYRGRLKEERSKKNKEVVAQLKAHLRVQHRLTSIVQQRFQEARLLRSVVASYEVIPLFPEYSAVLSAQQLHQVLSGKPSTKEILKKLKDMQPGTGATLRRTLRLAARRVTGVSKRKQRECLRRFLKHFVTLRRDLSLFYLVQDAMNRLHLQDNPANIRLSRANNTLYEFLSPSEEGAAHQAILNHVIIKADVRGSTRVVAELRKRGLNPASHFSLKFFNPINDLLKTYGGTKVFIEGDAVIVGIYEQDGPGAHRLSVARACGLARRLLNVVMAENAASRKDGLPELELGIGLVFGDETPTFLYDGDNQIMISSAIGKADRLSSCSWLLRQKRGDRANSLVNVEVCEIPKGDPLYGEKGEVHLRFNVNGIELDPAAFRKLKTEITLHRLNIKLPGEDHSTQFYAGSYPDAKGNTHSLVIREGRVRMLDREDPSFGPPTADVFYEVVSNEVLTGKVREAIKSATTQ